METADLKDEDYDRAFFKNQWGLDDETIEAIVAGAPKALERAKDEAQKLAIARYKEAHRKDWLPSRIVDDALRSGYYRRYSTCALMSGQRWVEDQMTGEGHVEGGWDKQGGIIGFLARIEMRNGYTASMYMTKEEIENEKRNFNPETLLLSKLIIKTGLQKYQGEMGHE